MATIRDVQDAATTPSTVVESGEALVEGIALLFRQALNSADPPLAVQDVFEDLDALKHELGEAIAWNTVAAPEE